MQLYKFPLIYAFIVIMLTCCSKKDDKINTALIEKSSITESEMSKLSECVESIKIVPLETNDSILIGQIDAIKVRGSQIYILSAHKLYHFDSAGNFVGLFNLVGPAPGEVRYLTDFDIADGYCYVMATDKIIIRNLNMPTDFREISPLQSGGKIRKINEGIIASFERPFPNGNSVMLFAESGDTICSMVSIGDYQGRPTTIDFIEYRAGEYLHYSSGNDLDVVIPADKRSYKMTFVENDEAASTKEINEAKRRFEVNGEIIVGMAHSKSHLLLLGLNKDKINFYLYDRNTGLTKTFDDSIEDDISGIADIQQNMMLGMIGFNESDNDYFISVIDPNTTYQYITDKPNKFSDSYQSLNGVDSDANPAVIFIKFK